MTRRLRGPIDRLPEKHYYYDSRADWVEINNSLPKLGGADGMQPLDWGMKLLLSIGSVSYGENRGREQLFLV